MGSKTNVYNDCGPTDGLSGAMWGRLEGAFIAVPDNNFTLLLPRPEIIENQIYSKISLKKLIALKKLVN